MWDNKQSRHFVTTGVYTSLSLTVYCKPHRSVMNVIAVASSCQQILLKKRKKKTLQVSVITLNCPNNNGFYELQAFFSSFDRVGVEFYIRAIYISPYRLKQYCKNIIYSC